MASTTNYLQNIAPQKEFANIDRILLEKSIIFVHKNPTAIKIINLAVCIFGMYLAYISFPFILLSSKSFFVFSMGTLISAISLIALKMLKIIAPPIHNMKTHVYKTFENEDAKLFYKNDVPILNIKTKDPYKAGFVHGYMLFANIKEFKNNWSFAIQTLPDFMFFHTTPQTEKVTNLIEEVKKTIPKPYLQEMQGLVDGYNKKASESFFKSKRLSLEDLILFHLEPDIRHIKHLEIEKNILSKKAAACSTIVEKDKDDGLIFARNTDWPTFAVAGKNSLVITRTSPISNVKTAEITLPGFLGSLASMNEHGLCTAMNICNGKTSEVTGMPNSIFTRYVLENSKNLKEAKKVINRNKSLGPFHLIVSDDKNAEAFFMKQGLMPYVSKEFNKKDPLIVTNFRYDNKKPSANEDDDINFSSYREKRLYSLFEDAKKSIKKDELDMKKISQKALKLPFVNNLITCHSAVMIPKIRQIQLVFDNAYSAKNEFKSLSKEDLF
ncbi:MAG: linear amide C-N hydrolase [Parachlamydiales bacterium]|nr:linear amide C-N hydrolase [Parachlamydiales bacterium]